MADVKDLAEFLDRAARTPFAWPNHNCGLMVADWVLARRGVDPAADLRGRALTEAGWSRRIRRAGGLAALIGARLEAAGLLARDPADAVAGDVGIVEVVTPAGVQPAGAICTGPRWAVLTTSGLAAAPLTALAAWEV